MSVASPIHPQGRPRGAEPKGYRVNSRLFDWIWHIRGTLALAPGQSAGEVFDRLDPLFHEPGTCHDRAADTLTFSKKDPGAQDKMSIFDGGTLRVENGAGGPVLRYHLTSRMLLFCFLAPLLFLAFGQMTIAIGKLEKPSTEAAKKAEGADKKDEVLPQNPIDKALGAPAPEKPKKDDKHDEGMTPTAAYVFAGMFAVLYVVGRILEARLVRNLFRKRLQGA